MDARKETPGTCVEYMEGRGDVEGADSFLKLLTDEGIISGLLTTDDELYKGWEMENLIINWNWLLELGIAKL